MKVYLPTKGSIAFYRHAATPDFWDKHWDSGNLRKEIVSCKDSWFANFLKKYLPGEKGLILEGGCGKGQMVHAFKCQGYNVVGIDFAENTVKKINEAVPEIDVRYGDVRKLPFKDGEIAGYWSFGVIEHFWEGYNEIVDEMKRVLRPGGYLFITFPYMSPLRKLKAFLGLYEKNVNEDMADKFYQFALDHNKVVSDLNAYGFTLKERVPFDGIKGFKDEVSLLKRPLQRLYVYSGSSRFMHLMKQYLDILFRPFASHCILLVFRKSEERAHLLAI